MSRVPRAARVIILAGLVLLLVLPGAIAPAPTLVDGQSQMTNAGFSGGGANLTDLYTYNVTIGGRAWIGNATASYIESTTAGRIDTNSTLNTTLAASTDAAEQSRVPTDSVVRFVRDAAGKMQWGPGNGALDTNLYRSGTDTLKTDDALTVSGTLSLLNAGSVSTGILLGPNAAIYNTAGARGVTVEAQDSTGNVAVAIKAGTSVGHIPSVQFQQGSTTRGVISADAYGIYTANTFRVGEAIGTSATSGYLVIPYGAGAPTGVPDGGMVGAMYFDSTNLKLCVYTNAWKCSAAFT